MSRTFFVPETPKGSLLWSLRHRTKEKALMNLINNSPFDGKVGAMERGYRIVPVKVELMRDPQLRKRGRSVGAPAKTKERATWQPHISQ